MQTWLAAETHDHDSLVAGAEMVLRLTRNRAMYQTIMRRPKYFENKIRYELNKFLRMRLDEMTIQDVEVLSAELTPKVKVAIDEETKFIAENAEDEEAQAKFLPAASGIRADHDTLPEDVASVWKDNRERWFRIKQLYNTLLTIDKPCATSISSSSKSYGISIRVSLSATTTMLPMMPMQKQILKAILLQTLPRISPTLALTLPRILASS